MSEPKTEEAFAARLNGREYGSEITKAEEAEAKAAGLVVVFGYSDDNVELRGAIDEEVGAYDGTTIHITPLGLLDRWPEDEPVEEEWAEAYFAKKAAGFRTIEAVWCPPGEGMSWAYKTDMPHATFLVMEDGETYCRGIVFRLADAAPVRDAGHPAVQGEEANLIGVDRGALQMALNVLRRAGKNEVADSLAESAAPERSGSPTSPDVPPESELVCYEAYQVVGSLLDDLGQFDTERAEKILDNLSQARMVHSDVLPWPSFKSPPADMLGQHVEKFAKTIGWKPEDGEGALEFIQRKSYRQGWEDGKQEGSGDIHRDNPMEGKPEEGHSARASADARTEKAIRIAELWAAGKMIGGDEDEVRDALLAEVKRLRAALSSLEAEERQQASADARDDKPWPFTGCAGPLTDCDMKDDAGVKGGGDA